MNRYDYTKKKLEQESIAKLELQKKKDAMRPLSTHCDRDGFKYFNIKDTQESPTLTGPESPTLPAHKVARTIHNLQTKGRDWRYQFNKNAQFQPPAKPKPASSFKDPWEKKIFHSIVKVPDTKVKQFLIGSFLEALGQKDIQADKMELFGMGTNGFGR